MGDSPGPKLTVEEYKERKQTQVAQKKSWWKFPELEREQRVDLVNRLKKGGDWNFSFGLLTALSTAIASLGLIQGSTATVIGAMVVAPLMIPLIASGLALEQGNVVLLRLTLKCMGKGVALALVSSFVIGAIVPRSDISAELLARAAPNILDLFVAYLSGFAAAYALALPELLGALAGVAIAVALVPPLAATGIGLAAGLWTLAEGASLLFLSNMVAIVLGSATVFRFFGLMDKEAREQHSWIRKCVMSLVLVTVMLSGLLGYRLHQQLSQGQSRAMNYPLTSNTISGIISYLEDHRNIRFVLGARNINPEGKMLVNIFLSSNRAIEADFKPQFAEHVQNLVAGDPEVTVHIFQEVEGSQAQSYQAGPSGVIERE